MLPHDSEEVKQVREDEEEDNSTPCAASFLYNRPKVDGKPDLGGYELREGAAAAAINSYEMERPGPLEPGLLQRARVGCDMTE